MKFLFINGVNLNMTGVREKGVYGSQSLEEINADIKAHFPQDTCEFYQSNYEGDICTKLHTADCDGIILNAGAFTHYSYAIRDAIAAIKIPVIEVHMSNVFRRESFRHESVISEVCAGTIVGFGKNSYILAAQSFKL
ncbi:MAG: type II 3-dehydroquinate dehydratase [Clostridia bacterium]|nr:type II 3-dehydroquinate dehydratase [Clostridia bacterium]